MKAVAELQATTRDTDVLLKCLDLHQRILDHESSTTGGNDGSRNLEDLQNEMLAMEKELDEVPEETPPREMEDDIQVFDDSQGQGWTLWAGPWVPKPIGVV